VFFSDDGATAVEAALKMAFQYRGLTAGEEARARPRS
jgi:adenosylmethionine-8-amino-7-oxononanoate aminotransferase